jgi:hypothetical protein
MIDHAPLFYKYLILLMTCHARCRGHFRSCFASGVISNQVKITKKLWQKNDTNRWQKKQEKKSKVNPVVALQFNCIIYDLPAKLFTL